jgi:hypothetical protein
VENPPEKSTSREIVEKAVEGAVGMVPIVGSPLAAAFALAMGWSYNKRMQLWFEDVAEAIRELQDAAEDWPALEDLRENDVFVDAVVHASRAAQATHQEEKLRALRNGVLNSIAPDAPSVDEQARFFRLVDELTPSHLRLLNFLQDPGAAFAAAGLDRPSLMMGGRMTLLEMLPDFRGRPREWIDLLAKDLTDAGLTNYGGLHTTQTGDSLWLPATSGLGSRLLAFVTAPPALREDDGALG